MFLKDLQYHQPIERRNKVSVKLNRKLNIILLQSIQLIEITIQKLTQGFLRILKEVMENRCYADVYVRGIGEEILKFFLHFY